MKHLLLILAFAMLCTLGACSGDDKKTLTQPQCNCYYTLVEGGQLQQGWTQQSDTTDCSLDGARVYYQDWNNGQPNDTFYRILNCH